MYFEGSHVRSSVFAACLLTLPCRKDVMGFRERSGPSVRRCYPLQCAWLSNHLGSWSGLKHDGNKTAALTPRYSRCTREREREPGRERYRRVEVGKISIGERKEGMQSEEIEGKGERQDRERGIQRERGATGGCWFLTGVSLHLWSKRPISLRGISTECLP